MEQHPIQLCPGTVTPPEAGAESDPGAERLREEQWVREAQAGDRAAMERLILHFQDRVWRRALYRIGDRDEAWDVAQEVFILCLRKIGQFRGEARFWTWLARIVDNQVSNRLGWLARRGRKVTFSLSEPCAAGEPDGVPAFDPADPAPSPRRQAAGREALEALDRALGQLKEDHREILLLRFADGLSYEEIAEVLDLSTGTVKSRISRARSQLRRAMEPYITQ